MEQKERMCISIQEMAQLLGIGMTSAYKLANDKEFYSHFLKSSDKNASAKINDIFNREKGLYSGDNN